MVRRYKPDLILLDVKLLGQNWPTAVSTMEHGVDHLESHKGGRLHSTVVDEFIRMTRTERVDRNMAMRTPTMYTALLKTIPFG